MLWPAPGCSTRADTRRTRESRRTENRSTVRLENLGTALFQSSLTVLQFDPKAAWTVIRAVE
jgi:hypothetical protein